MEPRRLRDEAEALAVALELEVATIAEAAAWADACIAQEEHPHWSLCDVATTSARYPQDVAGLLRRVPGEVHEPSVRGLLVQFLRARFERDPEHPERFAAALFRRAAWNWIDDAELKVLAMWCDDAFDLAAAGHVQETRAELVRILRSALARAADLAAQRGPVWGSAVDRAAR